MAAPRRLTLSYAIMNKLKVNTVDKKTIAGIHSTQTVDIVYITVELPNSVIKKNTYKYPFYFYEGGNN
jgi:hypothetical protein